MVEVEVKYWVRSHETVAKQLTLNGAIEIESREDEDHYFDAPDRDLSRTGEAFRIRRIGEKNLLTYKGPKKDTLAKTREEIEIPFLPGEQNYDAMKLMLHRLGYCSVAVVRKKRRIFELNRGRFTVQVSLDELPEVGQFVEIEIVSDESDSDSAAEVVLDLARKMGLTEVEHRSYLKLLLDHCSRRI